MQRFQALHHTFIASAKAVIEGHKINPEFKIGCMIAHLTMYPLTPNPEDILQTKEYDLLVNKFVGDVQVKGKYPALIEKYFQNKKLKSKKKKVMMRCSKKEELICTLSVTI